MSTSPDVPLSRAEAIWAELITVSSQVKDSIRQANEVERRLESSITTLESVLSEIDSKAKEIGVSSGSTVQHRLDDVRKQIESEKARMFRALEERDLKVQKDITEAVATRLDESVDEWQASIGGLLEREVGRAVAAARGSWQDTGRNQWLLASVGALSLFCVLIFGAAWYWSDSVAKASYQGAASELLRSGYSDAAVRLSRLNNLNWMVNCDGFVKQEHNGQVWCVPINEDKKVFGWRIK